MKSYINVYRSDRNTLNYVHIENGVRKVDRIDFQPFCAISSTKETGWKDIHGRHLKPKTFGSITAFQDWKKENEGAFSIYGDIAVEYQLLASKFSKEEITIQKDPINIWNMDIEIYAEPGSGFPHPDRADQMINAICMQDMQKNVYHTFSLAPISFEDDNLIYHQCADEIELLKSFVAFFKANQIDILTGWNITYFDIPYVINRLKNQLGAGYANQLSPCCKLRERSEQRVINGKKTEEVINYYDIVGVIDFDYMRLYKKFCVEPRESHSLDYISKFELGEGKTEYKSDYNDLNGLYLDNFDLFIQYNKKDCELVYLLDQKLRFIDLALNLMYKSKCKPENIFGTVGIWTSYLYNELMSKNIFSPPKKHEVKENFVGGFVKDPTKGLHKWVMFYDVASSYPNQIRSYNISPETILDKSSLPDELVAISDTYGNIERCLDQDKLEEARIAEMLVKYGVTMTPNGQFFRTDVEGFVPDIVSRLFNERKELKKRIKEISAIDPESTEVASMKAAEKAIKTLMNSLYGAFSNIHFIYYDIRMAEAITCGGQVAIRGATDYVEKKIPNITNLGNDTDSMILSLEKILNDRFKKGLPTKKEVIYFIVKLGEKVIHPTIEEYFERLSKNLNMRELTIKMEPEGISDLGIIVAKKRYAMHQLWREGTWHLERPKLKIIGIEIVRTSTSQFVRDKLRGMFDEIFNTGDNEKVLAFINETKSEFKTLPFEKISSPRSVNGLIKYATAEKSVPIQVKASLLYNKLITSWDLEKKYRLIHEGDKIRFCYLKEPNRLGTKVIAAHDKLPEEIAKLVRIDYDLQFEKTFIAPAEKIFNVIGWSLEEKKESLEDVFA